jgi:hypothetical protein
LGADLIEAHGIEEGLLLRVGEPARQAAGEQDYPRPDVLDVDMHDSRRFGYWAGGKSGVR